MAYIVAMSLNLILSFSLLRLMPVHTSACIRCQMSASHPLTPQRKLCFFGLACVEVRYRIPIDRRESFPRRGNLGTCRSVCVAFLVPEHSKLVSPPYNTEGGRTHVDQTNLVSLVHQLVPRAELLITLSEASAPHVPVSLPWSVL